MTRYIALLRGINVGGNKKVPMAQLRAMLESLGYLEVATLLQSGNAVFSSKKKKAIDALEAELEKALEKEFGFPVAVVVRTTEEVQQVIDGNPLKKEAESDGSRFLITFLGGKPDAAFLKTIDPAQHAPEQFKVVGREIYAWFPNSIRDSKLAVLLGSKKLGVTATARNWNTVKKLLELAGEGSA